MNRRQMIACFSGAVLASPFLAHAKKKKKKKKCEMVKPGEGVAAAVKYVEDASKTDAKLQKVNAGCAFKEQKCFNCMLAKPKDPKKDNPKLDKNDIYSCSLFPGKCVAGQGWCASWAKQPSFACKNA